MKFILIEAVSTAVKQYIDSWGQQDSKSLSKFFDVKNGVFKNVGRFCAYLIDSKRLDLVKEALKLAETESEFKQEVTNFEDALLKLVYPILSEHLATMEAMKESLDQDGYYFDTRDNFRFKDTFFDMTIPVIESFAKKKSDIAPWLFSYLHTNSQTKHRLNLDRVEEILANVNTWFKNDTAIRDIHYKLDVYTWLQNQSNLKSFGIDSDFKFDTIVQLDSKDTKNVSNGVPFYDLTAKEMRQWLNQFESSDYSLSDFFDEQGIDDYSKFKASKFYKVSKNLERKKFNEVDRFLEKLQGIRWDRELDNIKQFDKLQASKDADYVFNIIYKYIHKDGKTNSSTTPLTGVKVIKKLLNIPGDGVPSPTIRSYAENIAKKYKLDTSIQMPWDQVAQDKLNKKLQKELNYSAEIPGSEVDALEHSIVNFLKSL